MGGRIGAAAVWTRGACREGPLAQDRKGDCATDEALILHIAILT
jgi:hypothetical protein